MFKKKKREKDIVGVGNDAFTGLVSAGLPCPVRGRTDPKSGISVDSRGLPGSLCRPQTLGS